MMKIAFFVSFAIFALSVASTESANGPDSSDKLPPRQFAILVAGSAGYYNYRHQSDVAHAYKNLIRHGMSEENILVIMYDDVSRSDSNPGYNDLINRPYSENVYKGIHVDYKIHDVTPDVFKAVMTGDRHILRHRGTGRYLEAGPNDNVFIYLTDHGATGIFGFPEDDLYADELIESLKELKKRVANVVIFMEACESGSMFQGYLDDIKGILAVSASNPYESSYAFYYSRMLDNYLGDEFSINFLEYMEKADPEVTKLADLISVVTLQTKNSHVKVYGDTSLSQLFLKDIFGRKQEYQYGTLNARNSKFLAHQLQLQRVLKDELESKNAIEAPLVQRTLAKNKLKEDPTDEDAINLLKTEQKIEEMFVELKGRYSDVMIPRESQLFKDQVFYGGIKKCYKRTITFFKQNCFNPKQYNIVYYYYNDFYQLCSNGIKASEIIQALSSSCSP